MKIFKLSIFLMFTDFIILTDNKNLKDGSRINGKRVESYLTNSNEGRTLTHTL